MFEVSDTAKERLHKSLAALSRAGEGDKCFRVVPQDDKMLTLKLARPVPSDLTVEHDGDVILALPKALQRYFKNRSLDIDNRGKLKLT